MSDLLNIEKLSNKQLVGDERFTYDGKQTELTMLEFWRWHFSDIYDLQSKIAEYIVGKALGLTEAENVGVWTLYDMMYRSKRIEIKETSYYHAWQTDDEPKSRKRSFGITKAYDDYTDQKSEYRRQNDIYIFCLNTGDTKASSNPLMLEHWEFYIVPTYMINDLCENGKTISLSRVRKLTEKVLYGDLKAKVDHLVDYWDVIAAHRFSNNHMAALRQDKKCGCFNCLTVFDPKEITEWVFDKNPCDKNGTAVCPFCGGDCVIGESSGYSINEKFLKVMNEYWLQS